MTNDETYSRILQAYKGIQSNSNIIGNLLSKFVVNKKSVGYGVYNDTQYSRQIDLPTDASAYKTAMQAVSEDVGDISELINRIKTLRDNTDSTGNYSYSVNDLDGLLDTLNNMKSKREDVRAMLYTIMNKSDSMVAQAESSGGGSYSGSGGGYDSGGGYSGGGSGGSSSRGGSAQPKQQSGQTGQTGKQDQNKQETTQPKYEGFTADSYKSSIPIQSKVSNDLGASYNNVVNNKASIGNLLSSFVINGKSLGAGIYNDGKSNLGSNSIQLPTFDELQYAIDTVKQDVSDTKQLIENFKADIAALEADIVVQSAVPQYITVGSGTEEDPYVQVPNPEYAAAQAKIAEDKAKIAEDTAKMNEMIEDLSKKEEVFSQLLQYYNSLYELTGKNMDLFVGWSLYKNMDINGGKLSFGGKALSDAEAASIFAAMSDRLNANAGSYALSTNATKQGPYDFSDTDFKTIQAAVSDGKQWFDFKLGNGPNPFESSAQPGQLGTAASGAQLMNLNSVTVTDTTSGLTKPLGLNGDKGTDSMEFKEDRYKLDDGKTVSVWSARVSATNHPYLFLANQCSDYIPMGTEYTESGPIADPLKMAQESGATLAINGGRLNAGPIIADGNLIRQLGSKTVHETMGETLYMTPDGKLGAVLNVDQNGNYVAMDKLNQVNPEWALMGFHRIFDNGQYIHTKDRPLNDSPNDTERHPRTFIAQTYSGEYIVGVVSGARGEAAAAGEPGMNLHEMADYITNTYSDVKMIYNLDGGGSSFMYYNGREVENITDSGNQWYSSGGHRYLPELICFD